MIVKQEQVFIRIGKQIFSTLMPRSNENKSYTRIHDERESLLNSYQNLNQLRVDESRGIDENWLLNANEN